MTIDCKDFIVGHDGESDEVHEKVYYVFLPPELCFVHPLPGSLVRGAQRLPSIMRRIESMLLAVQLKDIIDYPVPASKVIEKCSEHFFFGFTTLVHYL